MNATRHDTCRCLLRSTPKNGDSAACVATPKAHTCRTSGESHMQQPRGGTRKNCCTVIVHCSFTAVCMRKEVTSK
jgi:hypothetical protein